MSAEPFARIPAHVVTDRSIGLGAYRTLSVIVLWSDFRTGLTRWCSYRLLAKELGLSPGTVAGHMAELVAAELLRVHLPAKGSRPTIYRLAWVSDDIHSARANRAQIDLAAELARGLPARRARANRALARGLPAHISETELFQSDEPSDDPPLRPELAARIARLAQKARPYADAGLVAEATTGRPVP